MNTLKNTLFKSFYLVIFILVFSCNSQSKVHLNAVQVIGSHNSYKIAIEEPLFQFVFQLDSVQAKTLQYEHPKLREQLDLGLRNLEFDIFHDPKGGHFSNPLGLAKLKQMALKPLPFDLENKLAQPGLKMFHIQDIDFRSHYLLFKDGLRELRNWFNNNPGHMPIFILINAKDSKVPHTNMPLPFTSVALDSIDLEIRGVFPDDKLITPDLVRGSFESLEAAILSRGWPNLEDVKGRFIFVLDENERKIAAYVEGHPSLKNRVLFVNSSEGKPEAAFRVINDPVKNFEYILDLVAKGYLIRTRADAGTKEARENDYSRFERAKASGAQIISTDFYIPSKLFSSSYEVNFGECIYEKIKD